MQIQHRNLIKLKRKIKIKIIMFNILKNQSSNNLNRVMEIGNQRQMQNKDKYNIITILVKQNQKRNQLIVQNLRKLLQIQLLILNQMKNQLKIIKIHQQHQFLF
ncbi:unnamed protein product [Paramecium sonneborni]|uniref:Uncharacterized protein n=1 Tax=Paramecium sonneborni TaxID=65129 RepID=A0A8S1QZR0_9CILI|nr:unnamed protein product [Paramecium sonneborni]